MRVLVLRPDDGARRTIARLHELGHEAISSPVLETVATNEPPPAGAFDGLIATSAQALRYADADALRRFLMVPLWCVGARTASTAREAGFADIRIEAADAAHLALGIKQSASTKRLLYLAGRDRKPDLENALCEQGAVVAPWVVYEARAAATLAPDTLNALRDGELDAVLHFSRRSAQIFCDLVADAGLSEQARALSHVSISADAAEGLRKIAPMRLLIARAPNEANMLALL